MSATVLLSYVIMFQMALVVSSPWLCDSPGVPYCVLIITHCHHYIYPSFVFSLPNVMCVSHSFSAWSPGLTHFCVHLSLILFFLLLIFGFSLCFVYSIGLPSGFDPLHMTSFVIWISFFDSVLPPQPLASPFLLSPVGRLVTLSKSCWILAWAPTSSALPWSALGALHIRSPAAAPMHFVGTTGSHV